MRRGSLDPAASGREGERRAVRPAADDFAASLAEAPG